METARVAFGTAAAVLVPWGIGWSVSRPRLSLLAFAAYSIYVVEPAPGKYWPVVVVGACLAFALAFMTLPWPPVRSSFSFFPSGTSMAGRRVSLAFFGLAAVVSLVTAGPWSVSRGEHVVSSDRGAVIGSCFLLTVFCGGKLVMWVTAHIRAEVDALPAGLEKDGALEFMSRGALVGWIERGLLFAFLMAGQPDAAALALAAKSLARTPEIGSGGKYVSEYFLIGTLASVCIALAMGVFARLAIGLPPL